MARYPGAVAARMVADGETSQLCPGSKRAVCESSIILLANGIAARQYFADAGLGTAAGCFRARRSEAVRNTARAIMHI